MATTKCHFSLPVISTGKETTMVPSIDYHFLQQVQMITLFFVGIFCLGVHFCFHILPILNIKTCSFQFHSSSVFTPANKTSAFPPVPLLKMLFVYTASKTLVSVQIPMKKNRNDRSGEKNKFHHKRTLTCLNYWNWNFLTFFLLLVGLSVDTLDLFFSRATMIHTQNTISTRMTSSCALLFSVSSFLPLAIKIKKKMQMKQICIWEQICF